MYSFLFSLLNFYPRAITPVAVCLYGLGLRFDGIKRIFLNIFYFFKLLFSQFQADSDRCDCSRRVGWLVDHDTIGETIIFFEIIAFEYKMFTTDTIIGASFNIHSFSKRYIIIIFILLCKNI